MHAILALSIVLTSPHVSNSPPSPHPGITHEVCEGVAQTTPNEMADWLILNGVVWNREMGLDFINHVALSNCPSVLIGQTGKTQD